MYAGAGYAQIAYAQVLGGSSEHICLPWYELVPIDWLASAYIQWFFVAIAAYYQKITNNWNASDSVAFSANETVGWQQPVENASFTKENSGFSTSDAGGFATKNADSFSTPVDSVYYDDECN